MARAGREDGVVPGIRAYLEVAQKRSFACALDWPGWCRAGRTPDAAVEALSAYRARYAPIAARAGLRLPAGPVDVVEEVAGDGSTEFGVPGRILERDAEPLVKSELRRHVAVLEAAWATLDEVVAAAPPTLRKGPRGGGRDRDAIYAHVVDAEGAYAARIGVRMAAEAADRAAVDARRAAVVAALRRGPGDGQWKWPPRYAIRRTAWHAIDHAWEIEDRTDG